MANTNTGSSRPYARSLDCYVESIRIATMVKDELVKNELGEDKDIVLHDNAQDISRWLGFSIYEDMFRNFMTCEILLQDQDGFFLNRLRTEESIVISFKTPDLPGKNFEMRTHYFYLYKIDSIALIDNPPGAYYSIKGISFEFFANSLKTFSRAYQGKTHTIVKKIYDEYLLQARATDSEKQSVVKRAKKTLSLGKETKHDMMFTFPYVNPVDAINHLASVSIDAANPDICNYVFFENRDGYHFKSITEMIENPKTTHKYTTTKRLDEPFTNFSFYFDKTVSLRPIRTGDKIIDTLDGVWGEYFAEYDLMFKSYKPFFSSKRGKETSWGKEYLDYFPKTKHLNKEPLLSADNELFSAPLGRNRICFTNRALHSMEKKLSPTKSEWKMFETHEGEYSFQRRSMMQQINGFNVEMTVAGNSNITVGDIVDLKAAIYRTTSDEKYLSGKYLVAAVNHMVTLSKYVTIVTLSRDSMASVEFADDTKGGE